MCLCARLSLSLNKIGGGSAQSNFKNCVFRLPLRSPFAIFVTFPRDIMLMNQILKTQRIEVVDAPGRVFRPESLSIRVDMDRMDMYKGITGIWFCNKK